LLTRRTSPKSFLAAVIIVLQTRPSLVVKTLSDRTGGGVESRQLVLLARRVSPKSSLMAFVIVVQTLPSRVNTVLLTEAAPADAYWEYAIVPIKPATVMVKSFFMTRSLCFDLRTARAAKPPQNLEPKLSICIRPRLRCALANRQMPIEVRDRPFRASDADLSPRVGSRHQPWRQRGPDRV
jgi:hypothetical protein